MLKCKKMASIVLEDEYSIDNIKRMINENVDNPGLFSLILSELVKSEKNLNIVKDILVMLVLQKKLSWRHLKRTMPFLSNLMSKEEFLDYYREIVYPNVCISKNPNMIPSLIKLNRNILDFYVGEYFLLDNEYYSYPKYEYSANVNELKILIERFIKKKFSQKGLIRFKKVFPTKHYDIVFDGNNILLNKCGKLERESHTKLLSLLEQCYDRGLKPLVFIHKRHIKNMKREGMSLDFNYVSTPYRYDDDWFSLYYAICHNIKLVSRDNFRDHINIFDTMLKKDNLKIFLHKQRVNITEDFTRICFRETILPVIIKEDDTFYIPGKEGYLKV